ncbi:pilus (MSHA type) biogenesis protein MshL [Trichlorobacter ammonificans]|uniref:MSHA biogenesis protein MshL n=1 Tax=Trichlorobacter ammonificans TaxID=2916410 RepID=A0ABN8HLW6_9BACT|nr:pilus (MSHA type) biogenesis protein MshL [Trichlorobacter ammonificans]CAH2032357.1 MSHA biogenesis protein MshL [Trichlorobacter ammonificans]
MVAKAGRWIRPVAAALLCGMLAACANTPPVAPRPAAEQPLVPAARSEEPFVQSNLQVLQNRAPQPSPLKTPDYQPVSDDVSPARTKLVNIQTRNSALGDVLHVIADAAGLNLIIGPGIQQDRPVTITLKRVTAEDALSTILNSADYFYSIRDNILLVEATGTKIFELGHPAMVQGYSVDVGGDILGSAAGLTAGGGSGSGSSSGSGTSGGSGGSGSSNIRGTVNQSIKHDAKAFDFWESLEKSLNVLLNKKEGAAGNPSGTGPASGNPAAGAPGGQHPQQNVVINRLTGTIMVTATRTNLAAIEKFLDTLKASLNRQVLVEARIIEVQLNDATTFGIDWDFLANAKWFNSTGAITGGFGALANTAADVMKTGTFRLGYAGGNVNGLLTALKTQGEVKTLSNPRISVMNGQTALLSVGRNTNYISKVTSTTTSASPPVTTFSVETSNVLSGMMIGLAPNINSRGEIAMTVTPIISDLIKLDPKDVGSGDNKTSINVPTVDLRELSTTIKVRSGEMIVIGGLISNKNSLQDEKIPMLGDIPWLGTLFSRKNYEDKRTELVVVLQPYLVGGE